MVVTIFFLSCDLTTCCQSNEVVSKKKDTEIEVNFLHHKQVIIIMKQ